MVQEAGIELLLHTWVVAPLVEDGTVYGRYPGIESKAAWPIRAKTVVDASGDGDMFAQAGEAYQGDIDNDTFHHCANTASLLAGVDMKPWLAFRKGDEAGFKEFMNAGRKAVSTFTIPFPGWRDDVTIFMGPRFAGLRRAEDR